MFMMDKMDVESNASCVLCCNEVTKDGRVLGNKDMETLIEASIARKNNLNAKIAEGMNYHIHTKCYKEYTKKGKHHKLFEEEQSKTGDI